MQNIDNSFMHYSQKLKQPQSWSTLYGYTNCGRGHNTDKFQQCTEQKKPDATEYILYDSIYMKFQKKLKKLWWQKADQWLSGAWGHREVDPDWLKRDTKELLGMMEMFYIFTVRGGYMGIFFTVSGGYVGIYMCQNSLNYIY